MHAGGTKLVIGRVEAFIVELPLHTPVNLGGRLKVDIAATVIVRIETKDGLVGWGECAPAANLTGETIEQMIEEIRSRLVPALTGRDAGDLPEVLARLTTRRMGAKAAVDMALHDLVGRARGVPVHELLGGKKRDRLDAMWMVGTPSVAGDAAEAAQKRREGYRVFKLKVGSRTLEEDLQAAREVRAAIGPDAVLFSDANGTMDAERAIAFGKAAAPFNIAYLEQPVRGDDVSGMARVAAAVPMPVCVDEGIMSLADIDTHAKQRAGGGAALRPVKLGGLAPLRAGIKRCAELGWKINLPGKIAESSLATAALLHAAAAAETLDWFITPTNHYLAVDLVRPALAMRDGAFDVPTGPGLGVAPDADVLKEYRQR